MPMLRMFVYRATATDQIQAWRDANFLTEQLCSSWLHLLGMVTMRAWHMTSLTTLSNQHPQIFRELVDLQNLINNLQATGESHFGSRFIQLQQAASRNKTTKGKHSPVKNYVQEFISSWFQKATLKILKNRVEGGAMMGNEYRAWYSHLGKRPPSRHQCDFEWRNAGHLPQSASDFPRQAIAGGSFTRWSHHCRQLHRGCSDGCSPCVGILWLIRSKGSGILAEGRRRDSSREAAAAAARRAHWNCTGQTEMELALLCISFHCRIVHVWAFGE